VDGKITARGLETGNTNGARKGGGKVEVGKKAKKHQQNTKKKRPYRWGTKTTKNTPRFERMDTTDPPQLGVEALTITLKLKRNGRELSDLLRPGKGPEGGKKKTEGSLGKVFRTGCPCKTRGKTSLMGKGGKAQMSTATRRIGM